MIHNEMRRGQLITPWGVGAIAPFPEDETLMIAGLDKWIFGDEPDEFKIFDDRLCKRLNVAELRVPPEYREPGASVHNSRLQIPAVRFPRWHYCPSCGTMERLSYFGPQGRCTGYNWPHGRKCAGKRYLPRLIPERFIVVCPDGHIDDFPIAEWIHAVHSSPYDPERCKIRRSTGSISSSLSGVFYECSCGAKRSLAGVTKKGALDGIKKCTGTMPWLGLEKDEKNPCEHSLTVVQRGGTNVWFPVVNSSIYIPMDLQSADSKLLDCLERRWAVLSSSLDEYGNIEKSKVDMIAFTDQVNAEDLYIAANKKLRRSVEEDISKDMSEEEYRLAEYEALQKSTGKDSQPFYNINYAINRYDSSLYPFFKSISLVKKLRETRALVGFSRLEPNVSKSIADLKKMMSRDPITWLPAIQVSGEGIFFEFDQSLLLKWSKQKAVITRALVMEQTYNLQMSQRGRPLIDINPSYILIHTFAHILINQLSYECGYGSSSIRERIYCDLNGNSHSMCGVLIYTASGDSEGSMGGLVRIGKSGYIENIIHTALENARWCSSDPVCIESEGQGPDSCNLAACHNCALLPETCCETGNRLLDRAMLIGSSENPELGYFNSKI